MDKCYGNLRAAIARRGIKKKAIANYLGISDRTLRNKLDGITDFTWSEVNLIKANFFPDMDKDDLFRETG